MKVLCTICGRAGSKGVLNKNYKPFLKKPLIFYTVNQAKKSNIFTKIVLSTDSKKLLSLGRKYKLDFLIKRPKNLSTNHVPKIKVIKHAFKSAENFFKTKFDFVIDLDITAPLRSKEDIINAFKKIKRKNKKIPYNLVSLAESKKNPYFNMVEIEKNGLIKLVKQSNKNIHSRQKAKKVYDVDPSVNIWNRMGIMINTKVITKNTLYNFLPNFRAMDIDTYLDFKIVEFLYKNKKIKIK